MFMLLKSRVYLAPGVLMPRVCFRIAFSAALLASAQPLAFAQAPLPQPRSEDTGLLQEIVVSATRQGEQSLQTVPMAISVVNASELVEKGLPSLSDFARTLPSVNMQSQFPGTNDIEMRGLVTSQVDITNVQERSLVALYLDDAPISLQGANPDLRVYDLQRIEVIRGPQGTLYGASSMAGTIRLITVKPDSGLLSGSGDVSVSETEHGGTNYSVRGGVNLPLGEHVAARIVGYRSDDSGFIDNVGLHSARDNPAYASQGRIAVRWLATPDATIDASAVIAKLATHGRYAEFSSLPQYTFSSLTQERFDDDFKLYNISADFNVGGPHLISSTSYIDRHFADQRSFEWIDEALATPGVALPANGVQTNSTRSFVQEFRLVSAQNQKLRWITGAFYQHLHRYYPEEVHSPGLDAALINEGAFPPGYNSQTVYGTPQPDDIFYGPIDLKEREFALFGEVTYAITSHLDATLGVRYFDFRDDFNLSFTGLAGALAPGQPLVQTGSQSSKGANPRGVFSYKINPDIMVYAEAARGFRYGGVNEPVPIQFCASALAASGLSSAPTSFGPDHLWNYSIGEKGTFADGHLMLNLTGFYIDWRDVQTIHNLNCGYYFAQNKGRVKSQGLELETKARLTHALTVGINASFTDAKARGPIENLQAGDGDRIPYFPRTIASISGDYAVPLAEASVHVSADYTYRSNAFTEFSQQNPLIRYIPSSALLNASVGYAFKQWEIALYATNLTDNKLINSVQANTFGSIQPGDIVYVGRPRTVGIRVHLGF